MNLSRIQQHNYTRAFFFKNLGYLFVDCAFDWYKRRNFLAVFQDGMLGQYIENKEMGKALEKGKLIFSENKYFKIFESGFIEAMKEMEKYIKKAKIKNSVGINDFFDLRSLTNKVYYYFEKTEFFFTDACYTEIVMTESLKKNLLTLGDNLKVKARTPLVELLTTIPYRFTRIVAETHGMNPEELKSYNFDEIIALIETGDKVDSKIIEERKKSFVIYCENQAVIPILGDDKITVLTRFKDIDYSIIREFKGTIANKGRLIAKARVVLPEYDQDYELFVKKILNLKMEKGEILVTETTSPDFVPLMKKAGGIIANQGGMNSHAAIMSRELGVPCLVGTHHATDILKTGDLIELNADEGIVKILKR